MLLQGYVIHTVTMLQTQPKGGMPSKSRPGIVDLWDPKQKSNVVISRCSVAKSREESSSRKIDVKFRYCGTVLAAKEKLLQVASFRAHQILHIPSLRKILVALPNAGSAMRWMHLPNCFPNLVAINVVKKKMLHGMFIPEK